MARIFTAGNELADPVGEGWYWDGPIYTSVAQRFGPRTTELNTGEWYYYMPSGYDLTHYFGYHGKPSLPVASTFNELYVRFHFYANAYVSGERAMITFVGGDESEFYTLAVYDDGGGTVAGSAVGLRFRAGRTGTVIGSATNVIINSEWALIEVRLRLGAPGDLEVRVNEVPVITTSTALLGPVGETQMAGIQMRNVQNGGTPAFNSFDNFAVNDTTGTLNNAWIGNGYVILRTPHRDGATIQLRTDADAGGVNNASRIGSGNLYHVPAQQKTTLSYNGRFIRGQGFVGPTAVPQKDTYTIKQVPFDAGQINAISVFSNTRGRGGLSSNVRHLIQPQAQAEIQSAAKPIPTDIPGPQSSHFDINPNTAARFTVDEVNNLEIGIQFEA